MVEEMYFSMATVQGCLDTEVSYPWTNPVVRIASFDKPHSWQKNAGKIKDSKMKTQKILHEIM